MTIHMRMPSTDPEYDSYVKDSTRYFPALCGVAVSNYRTLYYRHLPRSDQNYSAGHAQDVRPTCETCILLWFQIQAEQSGAM